MDVALPLDASLSSSALTHLSFLSFLSFLSTASTHDLPFPPHHP